MSKMSEISSAR